MVRESRRKALSPGDVLIAIDGRAPDEFAGEQLRYVPASSPRTANHVLWYLSYLFPERFKVELASGRTVTIDRGDTALAPPAPREFRGDVLDGEIAYLRVPSFGDPDMERRAVAFLSEHADSPALVLDLRGNGGGSTPAALLAALMNRPWRDCETSTPVRHGLFSAAAQLKQSWLPVSRSRTKRVRSTR